MTFNCRRDLVGGSVSQSSITPEQKGTVDDFLIFAENDKIGGYNKFHMQVLADC